LIHRERLQEAAIAFDNAGLPLGAQLIAEAAEQAETQASVQIAEVLADPDTGNHRARLARMHRWHELTLDDLVLAAVDAETMAFVAKTPRLKAKDERWVMKGVIRFGNRVGG